MADKFTAGPWALRDGCDPFERDVRRADGKLLATAYARVKPDGNFDPASFPEAHANALLIAAAPDLLAALEKMVEQYRQLWDEDTRSDEAFSEYHAAVAAIKKAKGENA